MALGLICKAASGCSRIGRPMQPRVRLSSEAKPEAKKKTCLYDVHVSLQGKMVDFAGYLLPIQYGKEGITSSHLHTRSDCSMFDVSHMLQTRIYGKDRVRMMESLSVADVVGLKDNQSCLSLFTNHNGGIVDDLIVTKTSEQHLYVVSNAGCRHKVIPLLMQRAEEYKQNGLDVHLEFVEDRALIALQGPSMRHVLQPLTDVDMSRLTFMTSTLGTVAGVANCRISRCGYTGEDGVEISIPTEHAEHIFRALLHSQDGKAKPAGLGARDSLRLEAGLCLYGQDIDETTTPIEAALAWTIGQRRRQAADFPGAEIILRQLKDKPSRRRVGLLSKGAPARSHAQVHHNGQVVGQVSSGCPSPSLGNGVNVAMAYVPWPLGRIGTKLQLSVRNSQVEAVVSKMPFVASKYFST